MTAAELKRRVRDHAETLTGEALELSHWLHDNPETAFEEHESARAVAALLERHGFTVEHRVAGLPTAFVATAGSGELVVAICAEYDALPDIGHACGHNVIAAAAVLAGAALAPLADELGVTVKVFGTPAEEFGGGKVIMLEAGAFDGVHAAMMVHPAPEEHADMVTRATLDLDVTYRGRTAHAAAAPHEGVNAADAATVAQVAVGLMRQQLLPGQVVSGIVTRGGEAANVIPGEARLRYDGRAVTVDELAQLKGRLVDVFRAGALATGASVEITEPSRPYSDFRNDAEMVDRYRANAEALGRTFDTAPFESRLARAGSTDMANVSHVLPTIHPMLRIETGGTSNHAPEFAAWCAKPSADRAAVDGGTAMALTVVDLATDPHQRRRLVAAASTKENPR